MADVEKPGKSESARNKKAAPKRKDAAKKKAAGKKKVASKKVAPKKKAARKAEAAATAVAGAEPKPQTTTPEPPAVEPPPPPAEAAKPVAPPPKPAAAEREPAPTPPASPPPPPVRRSKAALALWGPMLIVGVLVFALADKTTTEDVARRDVQTPPVEAAPSWPGKGAAPEAGLIVVGKEAVSEMSAAPGATAKAEASVSEEAVAAPSELEEPVFATESGSVAEAAPVYGEESAPATAAAMQEDAADVPPLYAPMKPEEAPGAVPISPLTSTGMPETIPEMPAFLEPPSPPVFGEAEPTTPPAGPISGRAPAVPGMTGGSQPAPAMPGYPEPTGMPRGYYSQRQFEPQPPRGYSSPLPIPGPGYYDPYSARVGPDALGEPPPPPPDEVWPERQMPPSARPYQPYYAPRAPGGQRGPYTYPPGRGQYGNYPYAY